VIDEGGGYHLNHDWRGVSIGPAAKGVIGQSRLLWYFSRLSRSRWASPHDVRPPRVSLPRRSTLGSGIAGFHLGAVAIRRTELAEGSARSGVRPVRAGRVRPGDR
jgi:hypothetical protein